MRITRTMTYSLASCLMAVWAGMAPAAERDKVEEALAEVRDVKADLFSRQSSVLGELPSPAELAAHQMRCRPLPKAATAGEMAFGTATVERAAALDPAKLRKAKARFGARVLPLGITGAYVFEMLNRTELVVAHVLADSPAGGVLKVDDIILGANGRLFEDREDPRPEMGHALVESQTPALGGKLTLQIARDRKPMNVKLDLGNTQAYSDTWPMDCEKSKQIRRAALDYVMKSYPWDRRDFWTPTFLLASGDDAALELARRYIFGRLKDEYPPGRGGSAWRGGYELMNLCEYYLLTGDSSVLPAIRHGAECMAWAQFRSGSWSHGGGGPSLLAAGTAGGGYGEINCAGLGAFIGLCLARQCGIEPYDHTLPRSIRFFGKFCGSNFPYGLGSPSPLGGRMDNGMNSMAAVGFHLLGEDAMADRWARTVCYMWMARERGHAEAIFSGAWGPVGAALAPAEEFHAFMNNMRWAYEMGRARDGSITFMRGGRWALPNMTAAMGVFLYLPERRLQILGGDSVFAQRPPKELVRAAFLYRNKQWKALRAFLNNYISTAKDAPPANLTYARKLLAAHDRLEQHATATLGIIDKSIADGELATAKTQLDLLAKMLGQEREAAARLRKRLGDGEGKDRRRAKSEPLVDRQKVATALGLAKSGVDGGFAHSPDYIQRTNQRGFDGMSPEQIAGYLPHFSGGLAGGAAAAMAEHGAKEVPLLKRMLKDKHPGVRAGALRVLARIYGSDSEEYRTEVPAHMAEILQLVQPLIKDPSSLVRAAAGRLVLSMKVVHRDIYPVLYQLAEQPRSGIDKYIRHGIKDPRIRVELTMKLLDTANRNKSSVPSHYKPMNWASMAHLDLCEPHIGTALDTMNNPQVVTMYGFFSNGPGNGALRIFERYSDHPLVRKHLPDMLAFSVHRQGSFNSYWTPVLEVPHRIVLKIGPEALPVVAAFRKSEAAYFKRIQAGSVEQPVWWKEGTAEAFETWCKEMDTTVELVSCLYGQKPVDQAVRSMCTMYLANRSWGAWERQRIRDRFTTLGAKVVPALRRATDSPEKAELDKQIAAKQAELDAATHKNIKSRLQKGMDALTFAHGRYVELAELASLIEAFGAKKTSPEQVRTLCRFYLKRPWGKQYAFIKHDVSYVRALDETQLALTRDSLQRGGEAILPALRAFIKADEKTLADALAVLDTEKAYWEPQRARLRGAPLARNAQEREDIQRIRAELADLAYLIECAAEDRLSPEQLGGLCRVYTRRGWAAQNALIRDLLTKAGPPAAPVIREHIGKEKQALPAIVADIELYMGNVSKSRVRWRYNRLLALDANIRQGIRGLESIAKTFR